ncbi:pre-mRNA-processing factor 39 isoform X2 [Agrilus planipennis]|uniref:Pre-mRNA-processing factor 39 n=1 Tax=Agrilus planipennis TaxID=224129 RepID=A0A1W4X761_AGRPL|nr:pre-mRNA-processing factor 39 isoform X2 [Agrilus planipennis]
MEAAEEAVIPDTEVRRTRSGRTVKAPSVTPTKTSRRTKKKVVLVEVEVSDEEETDQDKTEKTQNSDSDNLLVDSSQEESPPKEKSNNDIESESETERRDPKISLAKGSIIDKKTDVESVPDILDNSLENITNGEKSTNKIGISKSDEIEILSMETNETEIMDSINVREDLFEDRVEKLEISEEYFNSNISQQLADLQNEKEVQGENSDDLDSIRKEKHKSGDDPDTEVISEDELPGVQVAKVPETEEVSDEELPGPKRAELPADTEVVSEDELPTVKKESTKRKLEEGDYDPGSPTSENEAPSKKPALDTSHEKEKEEKTAKPKKLPELDKYWKAVNDDPTDFTGWTYLLQYVDQENDMEAAREAYDAFLSHYPYCYGYWRKYADYEKRKGNKKKCEEVLERGLKAIPLSVDLWIHYLTYVRSARADDEEFVRSQYERALSACGLEFRSDRLWDSYIKWETEGKRLQNVTAIYDRLLATPTQGYTTHFDNFQEHIASHSPNKVLEVDEFLALRKEVKHMLKHETKTETDTDAPPGDDSSSDVSSEEENKAIRERIVSIRRKIHKNTVNAVTSRWNYEEGIKRPYFHVKPLERCQLKNWQDYLDFEIQQGDQTRIIILFERCLIACALYEEFWLKYVHYLEGLKDPALQPKIKDVYERACTIHHLKKPNLHLQWAIFEESLQNFARAAEILVNLEKSVPNLLQVAYRRINLERRRGDYDKCCQLYEHYISNSKNKTISTNLAIKYARFCLKILKNAEKAVEILNAALAKDSNNPRLYLQLIDIHLQKDDIDEAEVLSLVDSFLTKEGGDLEQKVMFAQRKLEFLEDFGSDIQAVQKAYEEYQKYVKQSKENKKKEATKVESTVSKKDKNPSQTSSQSNSYGNYGSYGTSGSGSYNQYSGSQGQYNYSQYGQGDQYQYQNWQYPQGGYGGYNQWGGYGGGYGY